MNAPSPITTGPQVLERFARLRRCRACGAVATLPDDGAPLVCDRCGRATQCPEHTGWPKKLKWLVAALAAFRCRQPWMTDDAAWRLILTDKLTPPQAHAGLLARCRDADEAYPLALTLLPRWEAAGCPIDFTALQALLAELPALLGAATLIPNDAAGAAGQE